MKIACMSAGALILTLVVSGPVNGPVGMMALGQQGADLSSVEAQQAFVAKYCAGCHNDDTASGGFDWASIDFAYPENNLVQSEKVIRKVRSGMMPPPDAPRPDIQTTNAFAAALEARLDRAAAATAHLT